MTLQISFGSTGFVSGGFCGARLGCFEGVGADDDVDVDVVALRFFFLFALSAAVLQSSGIVELNMLSAADVLAIFLLRPSPLAS